MFSIRKFIYASLLAFSVLSFAPSLVSAQETARGKFTLTHEVRWGNAKLPAGDYEFLYDPDAASRMLSLSKVSGTPTRYLLMVPVADDVKPSNLNRLVLEATPAGAYVSALQLPEFGMTLHFAAPPHAATKELAKAGNTASAGQ